MSVINTKFSVTDVCYTFNTATGVIYRHVVHEIFTALKYNDSEIKYNLTGTTPSVSGRVNPSDEYEQNLYTEAEVKDLANTWLISKSVNIFMDAGL